ncbi:MAG: helix-turn-helix domain-containing protein [Solirubrobacterales bacterium]|nr:helix-turn-helix domain-containing protein [Solirubrobacterales bacterium]
MPTPVPENGDAKAAADLPFGALPARLDRPEGERKDPVSGERLSHLFRVRLQPAPEEEEAEAADAEASVLPDALSEELSEAQSAREPDEEEDDEGLADERTTGERLPERSPAAAVAAARGESDDDVHFGVAAKALDVSRKTVERMVKRGQLRRGPSGAPATVSKRDLVHMLEGRRRDVSHLARASEVVHRESAAETVATPVPEAAPADIEELLRPVLAPLLEEYVAAQTRAAVLENELETIAGRAEHERARDQLLLALATGGWLQRRRARRRALALYALRDELAEDETRRAGARHPRENEPPPTGLPELE